MKESIWGYAILVLGILAVGIIWFFANTTRTDQHNYNLLKETTEAAMVDAVDLAYYRQTGLVRIEEEKFVENFIRRFAENADLSNRYVIEIYDVNEIPPKVSLKVSSRKDTTATGEVVEFDIVNNIDAILETKWFDEETIITLEYGYCYDGGGTFEATSTNYFGYIPESDDVVVLKVYEDDVVVEFDYADESSLHWKIICEESAESGYVDFEAKVAVK